MYCIAQATRCLVSSRLIPESNVWLLAKGRVAEAEDNMARAARFNNATLPPNCLSDHEKKTDVLVAKTPAHTYTFVDLFRTPNLCKITLCVCMLWLVTSKNRVQFHAHIHIA